MSGGRGRGRGVPSGRGQEELREPGQHNDELAPGAVLGRSTGRGRPGQCPFPSASANEGVGRAEEQSNVPISAVPGQLSVAEAARLQSRGRGRSTKGEAPPSPVPPPERGAGQTSSVGSAAVRGRYEQEDTVPENLTVAEININEQAAATAGGDALSDVVQLKSEAYFRQEPCEQAEANDLPQALPQEPVVRRGIKGTETTFLSNFVDLRITGEKGLFEYLATFSPEVDGMSVRRTAIRQLEETLGKSRSFDGQKLCLPFRLEDKITRLETQHPGNPDGKLTVSLLYQNELDITRAMQFYNVLMRRALELLGYIEMAQKFFDPRGVIRMAELKLEIWPGFATTVGTYEGGLMLNIDCAHRILRQTTVYDFIEAHRNDRDYQKRVMDFVVGRTVLTRHNNRTYKVDDIAWNMHPSNTFDRKGTPVSYVDYFREHHRVNITNLDQPMVLSREKAKKNNPNGEEKVFFLPTTLCFVTGFSEDITSNHNTMKSIMSHTAMTPSQRTDAIQKLIKKIKDDVEVRSMFKEWGLEVRQRNSEVIGRVMKGPTLIFNDNLTLNPATADFSREATTTRCFNPIDIQKWVMFCVQQDKDKASKTNETLRQVAGPLGIRISSNAEIVVIRPAGRFIGPNDIKKALRERAKPNEMQVAIVILPQSKDENYAAVKRQCLVDSSIPSQVILSKTLGNERRLRSVMQKVALQINCKLGGSLWALSVPLAEKVMFVGVDTHHDPKQKNLSVLALVASLDTQCTKFYSRVFFQSAHQEYSDALKTLYAQALAAFFEESHQFPNRVVVYRDGISDGQLSTIKLHEVVQLRDATDIICKSRVLFSYVVVQKRINERFFLLMRNGLDNPHPGSIIDHTVTRRDLYDFFLISQLVRQGSVTPTHFVVIEDSGENKPDLMQRFSFVLSFMYYNWPGSIRGPAVCQYAHKLAMLVGQHLQGNEPMSHMEKKLYYL